MSFDINGRIVLQGPQPQQVGQIVSTIQNQLNGLTADIRLRLSPEFANTLRNINSGIQQLNQTLSQLTNNLNQAAGASQQAASRIQSSGQSINQVAQSSNQASINIRDLNIHLKTAGDSWYFFGEQAGLAARRFTAFSLSAGAVIAAVYNIKTGLQEAIQFQNELVKLGQTGATSSSGIRQINEEIGQLATKYGASSKELVQSAVTIRQAGYSVKDTITVLNSLAQAATAPNFGEMNKTAEAAIATMQQFRLEATNLNRTMGSINAVATNFGVTAEDIGGAIRTAGGAFHEAGGDINEFIGIFTSLKQTSRESGENIAAGLRQIFTRLQTRDTVDALEQLRIQLRYTSAEAQALGNNNLTGQFVGPAQAINRISEALRGLPPTDPRFERILDTIGGSRQLNRALPLVQRTDIQRNVQQFAQNGQTSLIDTSERSLQSLSRQYSQVIEKFNEFYRLVVNSDGFNSLAKGFLLAADAVGSLLKVLAPVIPLLVTMGSIQVLKNIPNIVEGFSNRVAQNSVATYAQIKGYAQGGYSSGGPSALTPGEMVIGPKQAPQGNWIVPGVGNSDSELYNLPRGSFVIRQSSAKQMLANGSSGPVGWDSIEGIKRPSYRANYDDIAKFVKHYSKKTGVNLQSIVPLDKVALDDFAHFEDNPPRGLYLPRYNAIALNKSLINSKSELLTTLLHEYGHGVDFHGFDKNGSLYSALPQIYKKLNNLQFNDLHSGYNENSDYGKYLRNPSELFAESFSEASGVLSTRLLNNENAQRSRRYIRSNIFPSLPQYAQGDITTDFGPQNILRPTNDKKAPTLEQIFKFHKKMSNLPVSRADKLLNRFENIFDYGLIGPSSFGQNIGYSDPHNVMGGWAEGLSLDSPTVIKKAFGGLQPYGKNEQASTQDIKRIYQEHLSKFVEGNPNDNLWYQEALKNLSEKHSNDNLRQYIHKDAKFLGNGVEATAFLQPNNSVLRIQEYSALGNSHGLTSNIENSYSRFRPNIKGLLQANSATFLPSKVLLRGKYNDVIQGDLIENLPFVKLASNFNSIKTRNISDYLYKQLKEQGYGHSDMHSDNFGLLGHTPTITDPGGLNKRPELLMQEQSEELKKLGLSKFGFGGYAEGDIAKILKSIEVNRPEIGGTSSSIIGKISSSITAQSISPSGFNNYLGASYGDSSKKLKQLLEGFGHSGELTENLSQSGGLRQYLYNGVLEREKIKSGQVLAQEAQYKDPTHVISSLISQIKNTSHFAGQIGNIAGLNVLTSKLGELEDLQKQLGQIGGGSQFIKLPETFGKAGQGEFNINTAYKMLLSGTGDKQILNTLMGEGHGLNQSTAAYYLREAIKRQGSYNQILKFPGAEEPKILKFPERHADGDLNIGKSESNPLFTAAVLGMWGTMGGTGSILGMMRGVDASVALPVLGASAIAIGFAGKSYASSLLNYFRKSEKSNVINDILEERQFSKRPKFAFGGPTGFPGEFMAAGGLSKGDFPFEQGLPSNLSLNLLLDVLGKRGDRPVKGSRGAAQANISDAAVLLRYMNPTDAVKQLGLLGNLSTRRSQDYVRQARGLSEITDNSNPFVNADRDYNFFLQNAGHKDTSFKEIESVLGESLSKLTIPQLKELGKQNDLKLNRGLKADYINQIIGVPRDLRMGFNRRYNVGGYAHSDTVPALLTPNEYVLNPEAVGRIGVANLDRWNRSGSMEHFSPNQMKEVRGYAKGGLVSSFVTGGLNLPVNNPQKDFILSSQDYAHFHPEIEEFQRRYIDSIAKGVSAQDRKTTLDAKLATLQAQIIEREQIQARLDPNIPIHQGGLTSTVAHYQSVIRSGGKLTPERQQEFQQLVQERNELLIRDYELQGRLKVTVNPQDGIEALGGERIQQGGFLSRFFGKGTASEATRARIQGGSYAAIIGANFLGQKLQESAGTAEDAVKSGSSGSYIAGGAVSRAGLYAGLAANTGNPLIIGAAAFGGLAHGAADTGRDIKIAEFAVATERSTLALTNFISTLDRLGGRINESDSRRISEQTNSILGSQSNQFLEKQQGTGLSLFGVLPATTAYDTYQEYQQGQGIGSLLGRGFRRNLPNFLQGGSPNEYLLRTESTQQKDTRLSNLAGNAQNVIGINRNVEEFIRNQYNTHGTNLSQETLQSRILGRFGNDESLNVLAANRGFRGTNRLGSLLNSVDFQNQQQSIRRDLVLSGANNPTAQLEYGFKRFNDSLLHSAENLEEFAHNSSNISSILLGSQQIGRPASTLGVLNHPLDTEAYRSSVNYITGGLGQATSPFRSSALLLGRLNSLAPEAISSYTRGGGNLDVGNGSLAQSLIGQLGVAPGSLEAKIVQNISSRFLAAAGRDTGKFSNPEEVEKLFGELLKPYQEKIITLAQQRERIVNAQIAIEQQILNLNLRRAEYIGKAVDIAGQLATIQGQQLSIRQFGTPDSAINRVTEQQFNQGFYTRVNTLGAPIGINQNSSIEDIQRNAIAAQVGLNATQNNSALSPEQRVNAQVEFSNALIRSTRILELYTDSTRRAAYYNELLGQNQRERTNRIGLQERYITGSDEDRVGQIIGASFFQYILSQGPNNRQTAFNGIGAEGQRAIIQYGRSASNIRTGGANGETFGDVTNQLLSNGANANGSISALNTEQDSLLQGIETVYNQAESAANSLAAISESTEQLLRGEALTTNTRELASLNTNIQQLITSITPRANNVVAQNTESDAEIITRQNRAGRNPTIRNGVVIPEGEITPNRGFLESSADWTGDLFRRAIRNPLNLSPAITSYNVGASFAGRRNIDLGFSTGGPVYAGQGMMVPKGTDTIPAMLTQGEYVINADSTKANRDLIERINRSRGPIFTDYRDSSNLSSLDLFSGGFNGNKTNLGGYGRLDLPRLNGGYGSTGGIAYLEDGGITNIPFLNRLFQPYRIGPSTGFTGAGLGSGAVLSPSPGVIGIPAPGQQGPALRPSSFFPQVEGDRDQNNSIDRWRTDEGDRDQNNAIPGPIAPNRDEAFLTDAQREREVIRRERVRLLRERRAAGIPDDDEVGVQPNGRVGNGANDRGIEEVRAEIAQRQAEEQIRQREVRRANIFNIGTGGFNPLGIQNDLNIGGGQYAAQAFQQRASANLLREQLLSQNTLGGQSFQQQVSGRASYYGELGRLNNQYIRRQPFLRPEDQLLRYLGSGRDSNAARFQQGIPDWQRLAGGRGFATGGIVYLAEGGESFAAQLQRESEERAAAFRTNGLGSLPNSMSRPNFDAIVAQQNDPQWNATIEREARERADNRRLAIEAAANERITNLEAERQRIRDNPSQGEQIQLVGPGSGFRVGQGMNYNAQNTSNLVFGNLERLNGEQLISDDTRRSIGSYVRMPFDYYRNNIRSNEQEGFNYASLSATSQAQSANARLNAPPVIPPINNITTRGGLTGRIQNWYGRSIFDWSRSGRAGIFDRGPVIPPTYRAMGGMIDGPDGIDKIPAMLSRGEYVMDSNTTQRIGPNNLRALQHFAQGGQVGDSAQSATINFAQDNSLLVSALTSFSQNNHELVEALKAFPNIVQLQYTGQLNVYVNGTAAFETMKDEFRDLVVQETQNSISKLLKDKFPTIQ